MWVVTMPCCDYFYIHTFSVQVFSTFHPENCNLIFFRAYRFKVLTFQISPREVLLVGWPQEHLRGFGCNFKWRNFGHISVLAAGAKYFKGLLNERWSFFMFTVLIIMVFLRHGHETLDKLYISAKGDNIRTSKRSFGSLRLSRFYSQVIWFTPFVRYIFNHRLFTENAQPGKGWPEQ